MPDKTLLAGLGVFAVGFTLALANVGGSAIPINADDTVYIQYGDLLALMGAIIVLWQGHKEGDVRVMGLGALLIVLDILRVAYLGSPL